MSNTNTLHGEVKLPELNTNNEEYTKLYVLFGIEDVLGEDNITQHVYTTSLYVPMDLKGINSKISMYYTGLIKHMELFTHRVEEPDRSLLYIYYDAMLDKYIDEQDYETSASNNNNNKTIKANYKTNKARIECLLDLYAIAIHKIKTERAKYKHIRLFSYDCKYLKKKTKFAGHPDVFGSIVRFLPIFDNRIEQTTTINISHAITPRMARILTIFKQLPERYILSGFKGYSGQSASYKYYNILHQYGVFDDIIQIKSLNKIEMLYGGCSSIKNNKVKFIGFYNMIERLIIAQNNNPLSAIFKYGIDEIILTNSIHVNEKNQMSLLVEPLSGYNSKLQAGANVSSYRLQQMSAKTIQSSQCYLLFPEEKKEKILNIMYDKFVGNYRYWPRIPENAVIKWEAPFTVCKSNEDICEYLGKVDNTVQNIYTSTLVTLLYGFDEYKPLHIKFVDDSENTPQDLNEIFTVYDIEEPHTLSSKVFEYMNNPELVVKEPYKMSDDFTVDKFNPGANQINDAYLYEKPIPIESMSKNIYYSRIIKPQNTNTNIRNTRKNTRTLKLRNSNKINKTKTQTLRSRYETNTILS
jgi:hypothetical protein